MFRESYLGGNEGGKTSANDERHLDTLRLSVFPSIGCERDLEANVQSRASWLNVVLITILQVTG